MHTIYWISQRIRIFMVCLPTFGGFLYVSKVNVAKYTIITSFMFPWGRSNTTLQRSSLAAHQAAIWSAHCHVLRFIAVMSKRLQQLSANRWGFQPSWENMLIFPKKGEHKKTSFWKHHWVKEGCPQVATTTYIFIHSWCFWDLAPMFTKSGEERSGEWTCITVYGYNLIT